MPMNWKSTGEGIDVEFRDDRGNLLHSQEMEATPKVGDAFDLPVVREGILHLVVTVVVKDGVVIVEPPEQFN